MSLSVMSNQTIQTTHDVLVEPPQYIKTSFFYMKNLARNNKLERLFDQKDVEYFNSKNKHCTSETDFCERIKFLSRMGVRELPKNFKDGIVKYFYIFVEQVSKMDLNLYDSTIYTTLLAVKHLLTNKHAKQHKMYLKFKIITKIITCVKEGHKNFKFPNVDSLLTDVIQMSKYTMPVKNINFNKLSDESEKTVKKQKLN